MKSSSGQVTVMPLADCMGGHIGNVNPIWSEWNGITYSCQPGLPVTLTHISTFTYSWHIHDLGWSWHGRTRMIERAWDVTESSTKNSWNSCPPTLSMNPSIAGQLYLTGLVIIDNSITVSVYIHLNLPIISFCYLGPSIGEKDGHKRSAQVEPDLATAAFKGSSFV